MVSFHDGSGYKNYFVLPSGNNPTGDGTFSAANGRYTTSAAAPNNAGTHRFVNSDTILCTNAAGQSLIWKRDKKSQLPAQPASAQPQPGSSLTASSGPGYPRL
jgi:hypothetical protein